jgi:hypothetical protein
MDFVEASKVDHQEVSSTMERLNRGAFFGFQVSALILPAATHDMHHFRLALKLRVLLHELVEMDFELLFQAIPCNKQNIILIEGDV